MISVDEAQQRILSGIEPLDACEMPVLAAAGLAVSGEIRSPIDLPPFANSAMDGFAVRAAEASGVPATLTVIGRLLAGDAASFAASPSTAIRIMTGARVPDGFDAVIPFEKATFSAAGDLIVRRPLPAGLNIRPRGEDVRAGDLLVNNGEALTPARVGLLAAAGISQVGVRPQPRIAILSTGDELLADSGAELEAAHINDANGPMLAALVATAGGIATTMHRVADDPASLRAWLSSLTGVDLILSSGGISAGDSDYLRDLSLDDAQLERVQVAMRPGKPLAFGRAGTIPWIALPGNPAAAAVAFWQFAYPTIRTLGGHKVIDLLSAPVRITESIENRGGRRSFVRAQVEFTPDGAVATPVGKGGSAMLASLVRANALIVVLETTAHAERGTFLTAQLLGFENSSG